MCGFSFTIFLLALVFQILHIMSKKWLSLAGLLTVTTLSFGQVHPLWMRYPSISPDGKTIVFSYKGDLYKVSSAGGTATPLTISGSFETTPVWSHDGKSIAYASDRYGDFDVFVIPVNGGEPVRITENSASDIPMDFTPDDKQVLFASGRNAPASSIRFSSVMFKNLYTTSVKGGRPVLVSAAGANAARYNSNGSQIIFEDIKGYEDVWRKHHTSSVTRDIWTFDVPSKTYKKVSDFNGEDLNPSFDGGNGFFYLSEKDGTINIYQKDLNGNNESQLTHFKNNPVRMLTVAQDNTLCFTYDGAIYTMKIGGQPQKLNVVLANEDKENAVVHAPIVGNTSEFALNPNGKEIAYVVRGEIFVSSVDGNFTKRITNTPQQERMVAWAPDGKSLLYAAERGNSWDIMRTKIVNKNEPYFYASTLLKEDTIIATPKDEYQPMVSPDGKKVAYIEERNILKVINLATKKIVDILPEGHNHSYSDGDWSFSWSPNSKWLMVDDQEGYFSSSNAALIAADGTGKIQHPINSGFGEGDTKWGKDGKMFTYTSDKLGRKSLANQGSREVDVYAAFFDQKAYDRYILSEDDYKLLEESEKSDKKDSTQKKGVEPLIDVAGNKSKKGNIPNEKSPVAATPLNITDIDQRIVRLTINSSSISDYAFNKDASKLYYLSNFEKGYDLWETEPRTHKTKILAKLSGNPSGIEISKDDKYLFVSNHGQLMRVDASTGALKPISINGEMELNTAAERQYMFDHAWRQVTKKFYDPTIHGIDWVGYKNTYEKFLPYINNNYDFRELLSELLGELNASHTGGRYYPSFPYGDKTASLGLLYDETHTGKGLKVDDIISGGPFDKADSHMSKGVIIDAIDGTPITDAIDWAELLNRKNGQSVLVHFMRNGIAYQETIKPITSGEESGLMYKRWVKKEEKLVDSLSNGQIGYVHVEGMNDASFRETFDRVMGAEREKKALIVDTRFNGGGWLHDDLNTFLSGKNYLKFAPQGHVLKGGEPMVRWQKPSCVLISEGNYSDAYMFPYSYQEQGFGKLIGMPVAGTGTAVWWERQIDPTIIFGIPMVASIGKEGRPTENLQIEPDIKVPLKYSDFLKGDDEQLKAAVSEMLKESK